ncbi:membrane protein [Aureimonas endophytica]|uniref:Membrane protein n=1 Tax=Aureimonas endophytica TaxID=2027858 RepID=A0A917E1A2_9HYPH|nr:DUF1003 domain-containing protein [Aureimonas endophytica]GGD91358.1 membrane protein [Aureimonas endophytica]
MAQGNGSKTALRFFGRSFEHLKPAERRVLEAAVSGRPIASDINEHLEARESFGDRLADDIARIGGSWGFIIAFAAFLGGWALINTLILTTGAFDPYPFIFLNLILSMLAAVQAPIIMMSQNRSAARDRLDASHDYEVNLKAEIGIMALHEKLDELRAEETAEIRALLAVVAERIERIEHRLGADRGSERRGEPTED